MDRTGFLGSSDIAAAMGLSRWKTPLQLYCEKSGLINPPDLSNNEAVELGSELEDFVARKFERKTGLKVRRAPQIYQDKDRPWMRAQVDRLITGTDELLECKTASAWKEKEWEGEEIPQEYIVQVEWQLMISGRRVGWIAVLIGGQKFRYKKIEADETIFEQMEICAQKFWQMVQDKTPPMAMAGDDDLLLELNPRTSDEIQTVETLNDSLRYYKELGMHIDRMMKEKDDIKAKVIQAIGSNAGIRTSEYVARLIDIKEQEYTVKKEATRQLRITKVKEPGLVKGENHVKSNGS